MTRKRWAIAAILLLYPVVYFVAVRLDRQGAVDFKAIDSVAYATQQAVKEAERAREATSQAREEARQSDRATQRAYTDATRQVEQATQQVQRTATQQARVATQQVQQATHYAQATVQAAYEAHPENILEQARAFSGGNEDWEPLVIEFDGVEMVLVPAGCFTMGSTEAQIDAAFEACIAEYGSEVCKREWFDDETPAHQVCFEEPFWIDRMEVTNEQFDALDGQAAWASAFRGSDQPREQVAWHEAQAFCESRGARLPTEAEWEYAARGPNVWVYPWGNTFAAENLVYGENSGDMTWDVGSRPGGMSWVGALDMSGNVWEWVADWYHADYYGMLEDGAINPGGPASGETRVARGGSWPDSDVNLMRGADRNDGDTGSRISGRGFRCARSIEGVAPAPQSAVPTPTPEPEQDFFPAGTSNDDWTPVEQDFDGVTMVRVPAGCFMMGSDGGLSDERPVHEVCFEEPFWIDKTEISNAQFEAFEGRAAAKVRLSTRSSSPREVITWFEAQAFCESRGARLPTEAEWEYAARGPGALIYPWGNTFESRNVVYRSNSAAQTADVGSHPGGASWVGALDMSGNVEEWVADWYGAYPAELQMNPTGPVSGERRVARGGTYDSFENGVRASIRISYPPDTSYFDIGFRCARSAESAAEDALQAVPTSTPERGVPSATPGPTMLPSSTPAEQAPSQSQQPVVHAVVFTSPSCVHCGPVINDLLPALQAEYDEQLQVLIINVAEPEGSAVFAAACEAFGIDRAVPTAIIGTTVLIGSRDIPAQMSDVIREGLAAGGIDLPSIAGLGEME